jgi:murein DD-endopeptidase MepM/ murein hydrolase activator NlpD
LTMLRERIDTLETGESLRSVFTRGGVSEVLANQAVKALTIINPGRVRAGMPIVFRTAHPDSAPTEIVMQLAIDRLLHLKRDGASWSESEEQLPWTTDTVVVSGSISSTLYEAMDSSAKTMLPAGAREQLTWSLADVFEYKIDMSRDLQPGDSFRVMAERSSSSGGAVRIGKILAATFTLSGSELQAIRYASHSVSGDYFDANGKSLRAAFLRAPLEFRRISSTFGGRFHPILGVWKQHRGTDYAASSGTPVRAIGDGVVVRAGWGSGYGNVLEIRHRNGYVSRYGHLRGFASGIHSGSRVAIGQTVAYVGMTGLATGPHLHFEVLVDGVQRDPRTALRDRGGDPVPASERQAFERQRAEVLALLETETTSTPSGLASR